MKPAPKVTTISCWNCSGVMTFYGHAGLYDFFRCQQCGVEKAEYEPQTADRVAPEKPDTPPAFRGSLSGDDRGERDVKETNS